MISAEAEKPICSRKAIPLGGIRKLGLLSARRIKENPSSHSNISAGIFLHMCAGKSLHQAHKLNTSLKALIEKEQYFDIKYGIKLANKNIGFNGKFYTFPYFLAFLLKRFLKENNHSEKLEAFHTKENGFPKYPLRFGEDIILLLAFQ